METHAVVEGAGGGGFHEVEKKYFAEDGIIVIAHPGNGFV